MGMIYIVQGTMYTTGWPQTGDLEGCKSRQKFGAVGHGSSIVQKIPLSSADLVFDHTGEGGLV